MSEFAEVKVNFGHVEIRLQADYTEPFPLYPYEELSAKPAPFKQV